MPIARYIIWVGTSLLVLLFMANWLLPMSSVDASHETFEVPSIRITSAQRPPESVFIDTNQPTIVPPQAPMEDVVQNAPSTLNSFASAEPPAIAIPADQKAPKGLKSNKKRIVAQQSTPVRIRVAAANGPKPTVRPTRLSFLDIVSGMRRTLFNQP
jgi:hypothetical protein